MQNTVNQDKRTRTVFLRYVRSYLFESGNYRGNGLVTQILLYFTISCFLANWQIRVILFISNELRFIRCVSLLPVLLIIFHIARHTFGTTVTLANGVPIETVSKMLGHTDIKTTQIYAKIVDQKLSSDMDSLAETYRSRKYANK